MIRTSDFLDYLRLERGYSPRTVRNYSDALNRFETYFTSIDSTLSWQTVDGDIIRDWMESMMDKGNSAGTICCRLSALRSLYRFALSYGLVQHDPVHGITPPRKSKPLPKFVREDDMERLLDDKMWDDSYNHARARTIIIMFYETGMRVSELVGLNNDMVDTQALQLKVTGKRNKQRIIPFGQGLKQTLDSYVSKRDECVPKLSDAFFLSDKGQRMTVAQVQYLVRKHLSRVTTQKKRSPHVLRHTFATTMLNHEAGIESVKKLLGHAKLATTEIYTHTTFEQLKRQYKTAHPRSTNPNQ